MKKLTLFLTLLFPVFLSSQSCLPEGITFNSQMEIDSFHVNYPGCTEIEGEVYITGDDITSLNGLIAITSMQNSLIISENPLLSSLQGLDSLITIQGGLFIYHNQQLNSITALENIDPGNINNLFIMGNDMLSDCSIESVCGYLVDSIGSFTIENNAEGCNNIYEVGTACGIEYCYFPDGLQLENQAQVDNFQTEHPGCTEILGNVWISGENITSLAGLNMLTKINGSLYIDYNPSLVSLDGLDNLEFVTGNLDIRGNELLTSIDALQNLNESTFNRLYIIDNPVLSNCNIEPVCNHLVDDGDFQISGNAAGCSSSYEIALSCGFTLCFPDGITFIAQEEIDNFQTSYPDCNEIEGDVHISGYDIKNLDGLSLIGKIKGSLTIGGTTFLSDLSGLNNLTSIEGDFITYNNKSLGSFNGLTALENIGEDFVFTGSIMQNMSGLENLVSVGRTLEIRDNDNLTDLNGLNKLTTIGRYLVIENNPLLVELSGLNNLIMIKNELRIVNNKNLVSLAGLDHLEAGSIGNLVIENNTSLSSCDADGICTYLVSPNGTVSIRNNDVGCNSPIEIANDCGITLPCLPNGNYYFKSQEDIDNFQSTFPGCTVLTGDVEIIGEDITNLAGLNAVSSIDGNLLIYGNESLNSLSGLENITAIYGDLLIYDNNSLSSLTGLENITAIYGDLEIGLASEYGNPISGNPLLADISGLNSLTSIGENLIVSTNPMITDLSGLGSLSEIGGIISIIDNKSLLNLTGLEGVKIIRGDDYPYSFIGSNPSLTSLSGLNNLVEVEGVFIIENNEVLNDLSALSKLAYAGGLGIYNNLSLENLAGLNQLESINIKSLVIRGNSVLQNIDDLDGLTSIVGSLYVGNNDELTGIEGLSNVNSISGDVIIAGNDRLSDLTGLCMITAINGDLSIGINTWGGDNSGNKALESLAGLEQVTMITGDLVIAENEVLSTLSGLGNVTTIHGDVEIFANDALATLSGLDNLSIIGRSLSVGRENHWQDSLGTGNKSLISLAGLDSLKSVGYNLNINSNESLQDITALNNLGAIKGSLTISFNPVLQTLDGLNKVDPYSINELHIHHNASLSACNTEGVCAYLASTPGFIDIHQNATGCNSPGEVAQQCGFEMPCYEGTHYFTCQADIDQYKVLYADCPDMTGDVIISGKDINDLNGLDNIQTIRGNLYIQENELLTSLDGLNNLATIETRYYNDGYLRIDKNDALTSLTGLNNLVSVDRILMIGIPDDTWEEGSGNPSLASLSGLNNLVSVGGISINHNDLLTDLSDLENLDTIISLICISGNPSLLSLTGLKEDVYVGRGGWGYPGVLIVDNDALTDLSGLEFIDTIYARLEISDNNALTSLKGLENLNAIEEFAYNASMVINNNDALVNLSGLENLKSMGYAQGFDGWDRIEIKGNDALESLQGIENIEAASMHDLLIENNPLLSACAVKSICDYLGIYPDDAWWTPSIDSNAIGCNSIPEVLEICTFGINDPTLKQVCHVYPNPLTTSTSLEYTLNQPQTVTITFYNQFGKQVDRIEQQQSAGKQQVVWTPELPGGVYFFRLEAGEYKASGKVVLVR